MHKPTLQQVFDESMLIEKDMLSLKDSSDINTNQPSTFEKKANPTKKLTLQRKTKVLLILKIFIKFYIMYQMNFIPIKKLE